MNIAGDGGRSGTGGRAVTDSFELDPGPTYWRDATTRPQKLRLFLHDFWLFGLKQAWACVFGALLLVAILATSVAYPENAWLARYDFLFVFAVTIQAGLLLSGLEEPREAIVIALFHVVATLMELFKTSEAIGSWAYPEECLIRVGNVPLFAGFMYSAVGSYIARSWRVFDYRFHRYPPLWLALPVVIAIYVNFFTHHFWYDLRWPLLIATTLIFGRTWIYYRPNRRHYVMPMLLANFLAALFVWFAENIGTFGRVWVYPSQSGGWRPVSFDKLIAWYLLLLLSGVLVSLVHRPQEFVQSTQLSDAQRPL